MKSWGVFLGADYAYAPATLAGKIDDMNEIMRSGIRFASPEVQTLWYEWQPWAVAAVERHRVGNVYPQFKYDEFILRSQRLHERLKADCQELLRQYSSEIGPSNVPV
jgi:hypothetical protein